jgi:very-short-patch-repair endonuclease
VGVKVDPRFNRNNAKTLRARSLRRASSPVEMNLWQRLRNKQLGVDFRRQHPAGNFILDFYAPTLRLVIELDGGQHVAQNSHDEERTRWLSERGATVLRLWNSDVTENLSGVLEVIALKVAELRASAMTPTRRWRADLPLKGGGEERRGRA